MRPGREPLLRERDIRDRERLLPEGLIQQHDRERERERERDSRGDRGVDRERERLMMMDITPHGDPRAPVRGDIRGDLRGDMMRQDRMDYEPLLPREAFSPPEPEKPSNSPHLTGDQREVEKADSIDGKKIKTCINVSFPFLVFPTRILRKLCVVVLGDDDGKEDDVQSMASVGEEYEPISDDELDEILADSQKKEDQQEEEKITGTIKTFCG